MKLFNDVVDSRLINLKLKDKMHDTIEIEADLRRTRPDSDRHRAAIVERDQAKVAYSEDLRRHHKVVGGIDSTFKEGAYEVAEELYEEHRGLH